MNSYSRSSAQDTGYTLSEHDIQKMFQTADVLNSVSSPFYIINDSLQIVYCNKAFLDNQGIEMPKEVTKLQPGDILDCLNAVASTKGCGTTPKCSFCDLRRCIREVLEKDAPVEREILLTLNDNKAVSYYIKATPFRFGDERFVSISSIKALPTSQKKLMESVFFHDLINLSGSLSAYLDVVQNFEPEEVMSHLPQIKSIADLMLDEIIAHRQIARAEENRLDPEIAELTINTVIQDVKNQIEYHPCFRNKELVVVCADGDPYLFTDNKLLCRVLVNMLKNAAEATAKGGKITLSVKKENDEVTFAVHNSAYIQPDIQHNIFTYGFSTKGNGHGIGTYSMRLLGENLLGGKVSFTSYPVVGTTFYLVIPTVHPNAAYAE